MLMMVGISFSVVVVRGTIGAEGSVFLEVNLGMDVGKKAAVVVVVVACVVVVRGVVVVVVVMVVEMVTLEVVFLGGGLVGMKGKWASVWAWGTDFLRLSSMRSVSTKPLKFCLLLSLCRLMTVMSLSSKFCSLSTSSSSGTSAKGMMLLSSELSMIGLALEGPLCLFNLEGPVGSWWSRCSCSNWSALAA